MKIEVVIVGAGLIGLTTAFWLRRLGADVHVIDAENGPGLGTSFANGGLLTPSQGGPWNAPGILRYALSTIGRQNEPFRISPRALPGLLRWGIDFIAQSRPSAYALNAHRNFHLAAYSLARTHEILAQTRISCQQRRSGTLQLYRDDQSLDHAWQITDLLRNQGLRAERCTIERLVEIEPAIGNCRFAVAGGIYFPADELGDAWLFCRELMTYLEAGGVRFSFRTPIDKLEDRQGRITAAISVDRRIVGDAFVVTAGASSATLLRGQGIRLPIYPVKGYSITIPIDGAAPLGIPTIDAYRKVAITPFPDRLRIAGTAEFMGFDRTIAPERVDMLLRDAANVIPAIERADRAQMEVWTGLRPVTPSGFPVLGAKRKNLFVNAGHGPLGWTLAAGSGKIMADLVMSGRHDFANDPLISPMITA